MKTYTFNLKANMQPLEQKLEYIQSIQKQLDEVMEEYVEAIRDLKSVQVPCALDPYEDNTEEEDRFSISPYEYPEEFEIEEDPFAFGVDKSETPFATVDDYEGLG